MMENLINPPAEVSGDKLVLKEKHFPATVIYIFSGAVLVLAAMAVFLMIKRCKTGKTVK
jgi:hypothetical protein